MITLQPMTESDFQAYLAKTIPEYANEKVQAGNWSADEALERSRKEHEGFLSEGIHTPGHFLFNLLNDDNEKDGLLWYTARPKPPGLAFIYDFEIYEPFRRRSYAIQALAALELDAAQRGLNKLELHVFGHNSAACELYKKASFIETNVIMVKSISS